MSACFEPPAHNNTSDRRVKAVEDAAAEHRLRSENQRLRHLLDLQDRDRQLIGYEIHDGVAQDLSSALMQFQAFQCGGSQSGQLDWSMFLLGLEQLRAGIQETRQLVAGLRPIGAACDLIAAIRDLSSKSGGDLEIELDMEGDFSLLSTAMKNVIFRILQEGIANTRRHSHSDRMRIALSYDNAQVRLSVQDWGVGFAPKDIGEGHFGLEGIQRRAELFGGRAAIASAPGAGVRIDVTLPG